MSTLPILTTNPEYVIEKGWRVFQAYSPNSEEELYTDEIYTIEQQAKDYIFAELTRYASKADQQWAQILLNHIFYTRECWYLKKLETKKES